MHSMRRQHDSAFKAKVALEALKEEKTIAQISSEIGVHANQIRQWRQHLLSMITELFSDRRKTEPEYAAPRFLAGINKHCYTN